MYSSDNGKSDVKKKSNVKQIQQSLAEWIFIYNVLCI